MKDEIEALDLISQAIAQYCPNELTNPTFEADSDSGELMFGYNGGVYVIHSKDVTLIDEVE